MGLKFLVLIKALTSLILVLKQVLALLHNLESSFELITTAVIASLEQLMCRIIIWKNLILFTSSISSFTSLID